MLKTISKNIPILFAMLSLFAVVQADAKKKAPPIVEPKPPQLPGLVMNKTFVLPALLLSYAQADSEQTPVQKPKDKKKK